MMKKRKNVRLCVILCTLTLLFGAVLGLVACTDTPDAPRPGDTVAETSDTAESAEEPSDSTTTAPTPDTVPETNGETDGDTDPDDHPETTPDTESAEDVSLPDGHVYLYEGKALAGCAMSDLADLSETHENGTSYVLYRPKSGDPYVYFANAKGDTRLTGVRYMRIKYRSDKVTEAQVYIGNEKISDRGCADLTLEADGEWHVLTLDLMSLPTYTGSLSIVRFDPMENRKSGNLQVSWIAFYPDDGAPDPTPDPLDALPTLPEDAPDLTDYTKLPQGSVYYKTASGNGGTYTFKDGFKMDMYSHEYFNRFTIRYESTAPLRGTVSYAQMENGKSTTHSEEFFLEAGEDMTFSSLIDGYFDETYAYNIKAIDLKTADGSTTNFTIRSVSTDVAPVLSAGTYYMENDRYIVGILLEWGGTISYIEDKKDNDPEIGNLINRFDPGRLVQQSYYGVGDGPHYTAGIYNGNVWNYNPVQGGNLTGKPSKLVDFSISKDGKTVYIKCRPQDWAQKNSLTPSYMENTYTLTDTGVHVSNRFVDFFGVKHGKHHAELPAFYTISHLGVFHYYDGSKPWTGDAYTSLPNEPDWAGNKACYHNVAKGNTECWAAWTNTEGYGIGLYVPGTEILLAGRHAHNGSKDPYNGATNYVAPLRTMEFVSFVPFEYEYIISTGTVAEMRETFKNYAQ